MIKNKLKKIFIVSLIVIGSPLLYFYATPESKDITDNVTEIPIEENTISNDNIIEVTDKIDLIKNENIEFELPIKGSSGYATIDLNIKEDNTNESNNISVLKKGEAFEILSEDNNWWNIKYKNIVGWVDNTFCMINLPDVIPSIIYEASNSKSSLFKSSGYDLPNITNEKLYDVFIYNDRFNKDTYVMPVLYSMAKKIYQTQQLALKNGDSLKIYETYRPYEVQRKVVNSLKDLLINNIDVNNGINNGVWNEGWFISTSLSNHQLGVAIDTSLVKVNSYKVNSIMDYNYIEIIDYYEYEMLTNMHELSAKSAVFTYGINSTSKTAWIKAPLTSSITDGAIKLQKYCTDSGLTPLASEWWHFNDLDSKELIKNQGSNGKYYINECLSNKNI